MCGTWAQRSMLIGWGWEVLLALADSLWKQSVTARRSRHRCQGRAWRLKRDEPTDLFRVKGCQPSPLTCRKGFLLVVGEVELPGNDSS